MSAQIIQFPRPALKVLIGTLDHAIPGQAITLRQPHRKFGRCYAEFVAHAGDGQHILVRKLISSMYSARWTKPLVVASADVITVHPSMVE